MNKRIVALTMVAVLGAVCLVPMLSEDSSAESYDLRIFTWYLLYADFTIVETDEQDLKNNYLYMIADGEKEEMMRTFLEDPMHADAPSGDDRSSLNAHIGETVRIYQYYYSYSNWLQYGGKNIQGKVCLKPYNLSDYFNFGSEGKIKVTINDVTDSDGNRIDESDVTLKSSYGSYSSGTSIWYGETEELDTKNMDSLEILVNRNYSTYYNVVLDIKGDVKSADPPKTYTVRIFPSCLFYADFTIADIDMEELDGDCLYMIEGGRNDAAMKAFLEDPRESALPSDDDRDSLNENIGATVRIYKPVYGITSGIPDCTISYGGEKKDGTVCLKPYNLSDAMEIPNGGKLNLIIHGVRDCDGNEIDESDLIFCRIFQVENVGRDMHDNVIYSLRTFSFWPVEYPTYYLDIGEGDSLFYDVDLEVWVTGGDGAKRYDWSLDVPGFEQPDSGFFADPEKTSGIIRAAAVAIVIVFVAIFLKHVRKGSA